MTNPTAPRPAATSRAASMANTMPPQTSGGGGGGGSCKAILPRLLTIDAVAEQLGMCAKTIRRLIDRGELRQHRFGRAIRVSEDDLAVFIKTGRD